MSTLSKIILRDVVEEDLPILYEIQREREGYEMAAVQPKDEAEFFRHWHTNILSNDEVTIQTIEWDGEVIGDVISFVLEGRRTIGYWIGRKYWGQGIATIAVTEFLANHEKRRPISAFIAVHNGASYRVLQKCGFHQVGDAALASDGVQEYRFEPAR